MRATSPVVSLVPIVVCDVNIEQILRFVIHQNKLPEYTIHVTICNH
eukprot:jgi/Botrbrau1/5465/Bobra.27_1s0016.1